jgi:beta-fructofuranosidase
MRECSDHIHVVVNCCSHHYQHGVDSAKLCDIAFAAKVRYVLKVSIDLKGYEFGTWKYILDAKFLDNEFGLQYDYGNLYASKSFYDEEKHCCVHWEWANESDNYHNDSEGQGKWVHNP